MATKKQRLISLMLVMIMVVTLMLSLAVTASAASMSQTISRNDRAFGWYRSEDITVKTGSGLFYALGWKKTTIKISNTGKQTIYLYERTSAGLPIYKGALYAGCSKSFTASGSNKTIQFIVQGGSCRNGNYGSFYVSTSAGTVR